MSKPAVFRFWIIDEPEFACDVSREWLANALRCYRKHKGRYFVRRAGLHRYTVVERSFVICISL